MLQHARGKITHYKLQRKRPYLYLVEGDDFAFLPNEDFDCVHAYGVFPSCNLEVIQLIIRAVRPLLKPDGAFDFTYYLSTGTPYTTKGMYYFHKQEEIDAALKANGLAIEWSLPISEFHVRARARIVAL